MTANLRLVVSIVNRYRSSAVPEGDLIQEGNLGLIRAMDRYDYRLGTRFTTYATWWIKQAVLYTISSQSRVIRLPGHMLAAINKINKAEQNFILTNGRDPSLDELSAILELPRPRISALKKMMCQAISLQAPRNTEEGSELENLLSDGEADDPVRLLAFKLLKARLEQALGTLSEREQQVIRLRFGLDSEKTMTLVEVSKVFNLTRERIRQIEMRAIKKLREPALQGYFKEYFS